MFVNSKEDYEEGESSEEVQESQQVLGKMWRVLWGSESKHRSDVIFELYNSLEGVKNVFIRIT